MTVRIGTRGSALALAQARSVAEMLGGAEIVPIRTSGDERPGFGDGSEAPAATADKSRFVKEIERALLDGEVDVAVHSAKDLPAELPDGLEIAAVPMREDPADAYVGGAQSLDALPLAARVGTSSLRRRSQLLAVRPDLELVELRGNVDTRLRRLAAGEFDGVVVAAAGLLRLDRAGEIAFRFHEDDMIPAPGQGALALQVRSGDASVREAVAAVGDSGSAAELAAERALVSSLDATCSTPIGARATHGAAQLTLDAYVGLPDGREWVRDRAAGAGEEATALGRGVAERLKGAGAVELLARAEEVAA